MTNATNTAVGAGQWHIGRQWHGHDIEDACPCPQQACGLVVIGEADPSCEQHPIGRCKTMRQGHSAADCPGRAALGQDPAR